MPTLLARGSISRPTLIWLIVATFLIGSGIGVYFAIRTGTQTIPRSGPPVNLDPQAPDLPDAGAEGTLSSEHWRARIVDRDDPNRLAGEIVCRKLDPLPRGRYALDGPEMWFFMKDGRTLHLVAETGNLKFFAGTQRPESGRFGGGVVARMYGAGVATPASRPDPAAVKPELLAYTGSLVFDLAVGEFSTEDVVNLSTPELELQGVGMSVAINEVRESLSSVRLGAVGFLHVRAGAEAKKESEKGRDGETIVAAPVKAGTAAEGTAPVGAGAPAPDAPAGPKIELYDVNIAGPVALTVGSESPQSITADRLLLWARLVDGALAPGAVAELGNKGSTAAPVEPNVGAAPNAAPAGAAANPGVASVPAPAPAPVHGVRGRIGTLRVPGPGGLTPLTPVSDEDALLTWGGELIANAVDATPRELADQEVALRFVSESDGPVMLTDARTAATVLCDSAHYGATTADVELLAKAGKAMTIADARQGFGEMASLTMNLKSGVAQARGAGFFDRRDADGGAGNRASGEGAKARLSWSDQADFIFATGGTNGSGLQAIREATFAGDVRGVTGEAEVTGEVLRAWFAPAAASDALLRRVEVEGNALGRTLGEREPQSLRAAKFDMTFETDEKGKESHPRLLIATGGVTGERTEMVEDEEDSAKRVPRVSRLVSSDLEAGLKHDGEKVLVTDAVARGGAVFERSDGIRAAGEEIRAAVNENSVDIVAAEGEVAAVEARGAKLNAPDLHLESDSNAVLAKGPGKLEHHDSDAGKLEPGEVAALPAELVGRSTLTWTKGMRYDNTTGEGEALGEAVAVTYPDPFTHNTVRGERLLIRTARVEPATSGKEEGARTPGGEMDGIKLLRAEVVGAEVEEGKATTGAKAEQRTYVADEGAPEGRRLEKLTYIEGPRLIADEQNGDFMVPAPGRALILDHSAAEPSEGSGPFASSGMRGTTLFEWSGGMKMSRRTELAEVTGGVRITHNPLDRADRPIVLEADGVEAQFKLARKFGASGADVGGSHPGGDQLVRATARGGVRIVAEDGNKEITADEATYHAMDEIVEASATTEYGAVTFLDKTKATPTIAKRLRWNRRTDEITIIEPMPIVMPVK